MKASLDLVSGLWRSSSGAAAPLNKGDDGQYVCPLCAREQLAVALLVDPGTEQHSCVRGHRFESLPVERPDGIWP